MGTPAGAAGNGSASTAAPSVNPGQQVDDPLRRAAHLLRRAGFGGTLAEITAFSKLSRGDAADQLLNFETVDNSALDARLAAANFDLSGARPLDYSRWWLARMAYSTRPLEERMTLIWHGLLTSQLSKVGRRFSILLYNQNQLYRQNALPRWDDFVKAVSKDPGMMVYLDTIENSKAHANENYGREQMELFTMGVGNYTEDDVREAARAYTGYRITKPAPRADPKGPYLDYHPTFVLQAGQHDSGSKTFLGKTGNFDGDAIIDIIMGTPAAARFITTRLFTEFANVTPSGQTIDNLVAVWQQSGHQIKALVRAILVSDEFYSEASYRAIVRSPVNFVVGAVRGLELGGAGQSMTSTKLAPERHLTAMDQTLFEPPNVAGWPGGAYWLSSSTFFARLNFLDSLLGGTGKNALVIPAFAGLTATSDLVERALQIFLDGNVSDSTRQAIADHANTITDPQQRAAAVAYLTLATPEYQLV
ncbi:MAG: DUF1800 domain-containing protein [Tepidiformaceae bacterium]